MRDSVEVGGRPRTYTVVGPTDGKPSRDLVLVFHGSRQTGAKHRRFTGKAFDALADGGAAVVVYLDGHKETGTTRAGRAGFRPAGRTSTTSASPAR